MKAWVLSEDYVEGSELVYADTRNQARYRGVGSEVFPDSEYSDIRARREPRADDRENEPRLLMLRSLGWYFDEKPGGGCAMCGLHDPYPECDSDMNICVLCEACGECGHLDDCPSRLAPMLRLEL